MNSVLISNKERNNSTLMEFLFLSCFNAYVADVESNGKQIEIYQSFNDFPNDKLLLNQGIEAFSCVILFSGITFKLLYLFFFFLLLFLPFPLCFKYTHRSVV